MGLDMYLTRHEPAGQWRKANAIHNWFVNNVQGGEDKNGHVTYVPKEKLEELLSLVNQVLKASKLAKGSSVAQKLLPTASGFFFGSTEYDQHYYSDLVQTKEIIEKALANPGNYFYQSSW